MRVVVKVGCCEGGGESGGVVRVVVKVGVL